MTDAMKNVESVVGYCKRHDWVPFLRMTDAAWSLFAYRHHMQERSGQGFEFRSRDKYDPAGPMLHPVPSYDPNDRHMGPKHICEPCFQEARKQTLTAEERSLLGA